ncbi:hypothetical protein BS50DRAFT_203401 [Corynespora cassiicola Philippines]|uniref:Restriction endonuclease domain-containing protein n=1 Tax=Corynespora cassiicola Philippines TaxID=1448308 RepID=A0A2T2N517_CORCC|nr:hypothetical protein BS50DRAFT_203401 [Corynespora cassiicola Philippines]
MATGTPQHASAQNMGAGLPAYPQTQPSACQSPSPPDQSPTPLEKVKSTITQMRKGSYLQGNIEIDNLTAADFQRMRFELPEEEWVFFQDKVRYAYTNNKLFITIPSGPQELASHKLAELIQTTLKQHRHDSTWGPFLRHIQSMGSTNFDLDGVTSRTPNECWQHTSAKWPGVVVEVQFTKREYPEKQAYDWLVRSRNNIKVLIIVILPLTLGDDSFTVQTWKSQYRDHVWGKKLVSKNVGLSFIVCEFNID